jgi:hypothetical protein
VGTSDVIPREDNDDVLDFYNIQGESVYSGPPDPNLPTIDHGLDEEHIWVFPKNILNQEVIINHAASLNENT